MPTLTERSNCPPSSPFSPFRLCLPPQITAAVASRGLIVKPGSVTLSAPIDPAVIPKPPAPKKKGLGTGALVGIIIGVVAAVLIVVGVVVLMKKKAGAEAAIGPKV